MEDIPAELLSLTCNVLYDARLSELKKQVRELNKEVEKLKGMEPEVEYIYMLENDRPIILDGEFNIKIGSLKISKAFRFLSSDIDKLERMINIIKEKIEVSDNIYLAIERTGFDQDIYLMLNKDDILINDNGESRARIHISREAMLPALEKIYRVLNNINNE